MLHYDDGDGNYEFPLDDKPAKVDGNVVVKPFQLSVQSQTSGGIPSPL